MAITSPTAEEYATIKALFGESDRAHQSYTESCVSAAMLLESRYDELDDHAKRIVDTVRDARRRWLAASDAAQAAYRAPLIADGALAEAGDSDA